MLRRDFYGFTRNQAKHGREDPAVFHSRNYFYALVGVYYRSGRVFYGKLCGRRGDSGGEPWPSHCISVSWGGPDDLHWRCSDLRDGSWIRRQGLLQAGVLPDDSHYNSSFSGNQRCHVDLFPPDVNPAEGRRRSKSVFSRVLFHHAFGVSGNGGKFCFRDVYPRGRASGIFHEGDGVKRLVECRLRLRIRWNTSFWGVRDRLGFLCFRIGLPGLDLVLFLEKGRSLPLGNV